MQLKNTVNLLSLLMTLAYANSSFAVNTGLPVFSVPNAEGIISFYANPTNCPAGEAHIAPKTSIPITEKNIPNTENWAWNYRGDGSCFVVPDQKTEPLKYIDFSQTGISSGNTIKATYNFADNSHPIVFTFTIPANWECSALYMQNSQNDNHPILPLFIGCQYKKTTFN